MFGQHSVLMTGATAGRSTGFFMRGSQGLRLVTVAHAFGTRPASTSWRRWDNSCEVHLADGKVTVPAFNRGRKRLFSYFAISPPGAMVDAISIHLDPDLALEMEEKGLPPLVEETVHGFGSGAEMSAYGFVDGVLTRRDGAFLFSDNDVFFRSSIVTEPGMSGCPVFSPFGALTGMAVGFDDLGSSVIVSAPMINYLVERADPGPAPETG